MSNFDQKNQKVGTQYNADKIIIVTASEQHIAELGKKANKYQKPEVNKLFSEILRGENKRLNQNGFFIEHNTSVEDSSPIVDVLLVCALKDEYNQVVNITEGLLPPGWEQSKSSDFIVSNGRFSTATGSPLSIRVTWSSHMGREHVQAFTSKLIADNPTRCIAMSGICAGRRGEVALGDVIFADRLWSYDVGKTKVENGKQTFQGDMLQYHPASSWVQRMQSVSLPSDSQWLALRPKLPLENQENWVLSCLLAGITPQKHADFNSACPNWHVVLSRLLKRDWLVQKRKWFKKSLILTHTGQETAEKLKLFYPQDLPVPNDFQIHVAPMATGSAVIEDEGIFPRLANSMRKVLGIDMEASALAALAEFHDIPVLIAKGVSDYGDTFKDDRYRDFAARASAECLIALIRESTDLFPDLCPGDDKVIVQKDVEVFHKRFDKIDSKMEMIRGYEDVVLTEYQSAEAKKVLQEILKRRSSFDQDTMKELNQLVNELSATGKFRAASTSIKAEIYNWCARIAAGKELLSDAERAINMVSELGETISPIALAWVDVARGNIDKGLQLLRGIDDAEIRGNIFHILRMKKGNAEALFFFDSLENISSKQFTAIGWRNVIGSLAEAERTDDASKLFLSLPHEFVIECPVLGYIGGIVCASYLVPKEHQHRIIYEEFIAFNKHILEGADVELWLQRAHDSFQLSADSAIKLNDHLLEKSALLWLRWLKLINPVYKKDELESLIVDMNNGSKAVEMIAFAVNFDVDFDSKPIENHLIRNEILGGLSPKELNAKLLLLRYFKRFTELAQFIEDYWERLLEVGNSEGLGGELIYAYVGAGECGCAEKVLNDKKNELYHLDVPRYQLMIEQCQGKDPTQQAKKIYESSKAIEDLWNVVRGLESKQRWEELKPYSIILFERESNSENALRVVECIHQTNGPEESIIEFLNAHPDLVKLSNELKSIQAWTFFHLGQVDEARKLNNELLNIRRNDNDLRLDIYLATRLGDWEYFADIIAREWGQRRDLSSQMLLHLAKLAGWGSKDRAILLAQEAVDQQPNDPNIFLQAYNIASSLARDDIAMPWMNQAAILSKESSGPVVSYSFRETVEIMKNHGDDWHRKNELFRNSKIPIHWAASMLNIPLSRLLIAIPRENKEQSDARKRYPIPVRSGSRQPIDTKDVNKLFLDISSIFILSELGLLDKLFCVMEQIALSPRTMEVLLYEKDKVAFHQPSRIAAAKPLLEQYRHGHIQLIYEKEYSILSEEVGEEMASLLECAQSSGGLCIHSGKLYKVGSYMDIEADLGEMENYLAGPTVIVNALLNEGRITSTIQDKALLYLSRVGNDELPDRTLLSGAPVFIDKVTLQYLAEAGLLSELIKTGRKISVHSSAIDDWESLVATEQYTTAMIDALENIRQILKSGMIAHKVKFIREGKRDKDDELVSYIEMPVIDLLEDGGCVDAVCIDDRFFNSMPFLEDRKGRSVPMICSLDVINLLVTRGEITDVERREAIHLMREWTLFAIPINKEELLHILSENKVNDKGEFVEGAEMRSIREYLARLHSADVLCTESDLNFLDGLWHTGLAVVKKLWSDENINVEVVEANADWVIDHIMPDIELALRFSSKKEERVEEIAKARMLTILAPPVIPVERRSFYVDWLERRIINPLLPANSQLLNNVADSLCQWVKVRSKEIVNDIGKPCSNNATENST